MNHIATLKIPINTIGQRTPKPWDPLFQNATINPTTTTPIKTTTTTTKTPTKSSTPKVVPINPYDSVVSASGAKVTALEAQKPAAYQSAYQGQIDGLLQSILNGEKFNYDVQADPLYRQYKDQYMQLGNQAMRETTANAATLTGGYGNSYAATAGNQAYQNQLGQLNNVIPSLYSAAMSAHQNRQTEKQNQLSALNSQEGAAYQKHLNELSGYQSDLSYWYNKYRDVKTLQKNWKG